jgi:hypothetical protein
MNAQYKFSLFFWLALSVSTGAAFADSSAGADAANSPCTTQTPLDTPSTDPNLKMEQDRITNEMARCQGWVKMVEQSRVTGAALDLNMVATQKAAVQHQIDYWDHKYQTDSAPVVAKPVLSVNAPALPEENSTAFLNKTIPANPHIAAEVSCTSPGTFQTILSSTAVQKVIAPTVSSANLHSATGHDYLSCIKAMEPELLHSKQKFWFPFENEQTFGIHCGAEDGTSEKQLSFVFLSEKGGFRRVIFPKFTSGSGASLVEFPVSMAPFQSNGRKYYIGDWTQRFDLVHDDEDQFTSYVTKDVTGAESDNGTDMELSPAKMHSLMNQYQNGRVSHGFSSISSLKPLTDTRSLNAAKDCVQSHINDMMLDYIILHRTNTSSPSNVYQSMQQSFPACGKVFNFSDFQSANALDRH